MLVLNNKDTINTEKLNNEDDKKQNNKDKIIKNINDLLNDREEKNINYQDKKKNNNFNKKPQFLFSKKIINNDNRSSRLKNYHTNSEKETFRKSHLKNNLTIETEPIITLEKLEKIKLSTEKKFQMLRHAYKKYYKSHFKKGEKLLNQENELESDLDNNDDLSEKKVIIAPTENKLNYELEYLTYIAKNKPINPFSIDSALFNDKNINYKTINNESDDNEYYENNITKTFKKSNISYLNEINFEKNIFNYHYGNTEFNTIQYDNESKNNFYEEENDKHQFNTISNEKKSNHLYKTKQIKKTNKTINKANLNSNLNNYQKNINKDNVKVIIKNNKFYFSKRTNSSSKPYKPNIQLKMNNAIKNNYIMTVSDNNTIETDKNKDSLQKSHLFYDDKNRNYLNLSRNKSKSLGPNQINEFIFDNNKINKKKINNYKIKSSFNIYTNIIPKNNKNYNSNLINSEEHKGKPFYSIADEKLKKQLYPPNSIDSNHLILFK